LADQTFQDRSFGWEPDRRGKNADRWSGREQDEGGNPSPTVVTEHEPFWELCGREGASTLRGKGEKYTVGGGPKEKIHWGTQLNGEGVKKGSASPRSRLREEN